MLARALGVGYAAAWAAGLGFGYALARSSWWTRGAAWERDVLVWFNQHPLAPALDSMMLAVPYLGTNLTALPAVLVAGVWLWRTGRLRLAVQLVVVCLGSLSLNPTMKHLLDRPRPALFTLRGLWDWPSYPSGHAILTVALYGTIARMMHQHLGWRWGYPVTAIVVMLTCYSRLYLAVHWPTDLVGGLLIGAVWLVGSWRAFARANDSQERGVPAGERAILQGRSDEPSATG